MVPASRINAGEDFDEGGFARAVFAHEGMNFAGAEGEIDVGESQDAGESFGESADVEQFACGAGHARFSLGSGASCLRSRVKVA